MNKNANKIYKTNRDVFVPIRGKATSELTPELTDTGYAACILSPGYVDCRIVSLIGKLTRRGCTNADALVRAVSRTLAQTLMRDYKYMLAKKRLRIMTDANVCPDAAMFAAPVLSDEDAETLFASSADDLKDIIDAAVDKLAVGYGMLDREIIKNLAEASAKECIRYMPTFSVNTFAERYESELKLEIEYFMLQSDLTAKSTPTNSRVGVLPLL